MLCDNAYTKGSGLGIALHPQCYNNKATRLVTVIYHELEQDSFYLCEECTKHLRRNARRYGYRVQSSRLRG